MKLTLSELSWIIDHRFICGILKTGNIFLAILFKEIKEDVKNMKYPAESQGTEYRCAYCGEINHTFVDPSQGKTQKYIEDCQVCCRPNKLSISYDQWNKEFIIQARQAQ